MLTDLTQPNQPPLQFNALLRVVQPFEIPSELVNDPREKTIAEAERNSQTQAVQCNDHVQDEQLNQWQVVSRDDNPATFTTVFFLIKLVPNVDN